MKMSSKDQKKSKSVPQQEPEEETPQLGLRAFFGIGLVAGALFNVPSILKVPQTKEDIIYLVTVLVMGLAGALLLLLPIGKD